MTKLREFGLLRLHFNQGAARACNGAFQQLHEHPRGAKSNAATILFLPCLIAEFLHDDDVALAHDLVNLATMQAFAVGSQLAFLFRLAAPGPLVAATVLPPQALLALFLDPSLCVVVLWIGRSPLPAHLALQAADLLLLRGEFCTQHLQARYSLPGNQGDGGWSQIRTKGVTSHRMLGLVVGHSFQNQLHEVAGAFSIRSLGSGTGSAASDQAGVLDFLVQTMLEDGIVPVNESLKLILLPQQEALRAFCRRLGAQSAVPYRCVCSRYCRACEPCS